ncbi:MAG: hypothetical protein RIG61_07020 [Deltaproteobacteria bacterium]
MNISDSLSLSKNMKEEVARDLFALGGLPFYLLVLVRATIGNYHTFLYQVVIALPVMFLMSKFVKNSNLHIARGLILVVFTSIFYEALSFTIFSILVWVFMILSLIYLKVDTKEIIKGVALGVVSVVISYSLTLLIIPA